VTMDNNYNICNKCGVITFDKQVKNLKTLFKTYVMTELKDRVSTLKKIKLLIRLGQELTLEDTDPDRQTLYDELLKNLM